jgi:hypothetical protein
MAALMAVLLQQSEAELSMNNQNQKKSNSLRVMLCSRCRSVSLSKGCNAVATLCSLCTRHKCYIKAQQLKHHETSMVC